MRHSSSTPPVSPARTIATYSGPNTLGWRAIASDRSRPASTSCRTPAIASRSTFDPVCVSSTCSARIIDMPEVTIVASWREATARSLAFTRENSSMFSSFERYLCAMSTTTRPRSLSCSATACLESASTSPLA